MPVFIQHFQNILAVARAGATAWVAGGIHVTNRGAVRSVERKGQYLSCSSDRGFPLLRWDKHRVQLDFIRVLTCTVPVVPPGHAETPVARRKSASGRQSGATLFLGVQEGMHKPNL